MAGQGNDNAALSCPIVEDTIRPGRVARFSGPYSGQTVEEDIRGLVKYSLKNVKTIDIIGMGT